jgi:hypothetical protein
MARLSVTWGNPRLTVTYPAVASELAKLLVADLSGVSAFAPGLEQEHRLASALSASTEVGGDIQAGEFTLSAALAATGAFIPDISQTHHLGAALSGVGAASSDITVSFDLATALEATSALTGGVQQTHALGAALTGAGALTGDVEVTAGASDPAFRVAVVPYTGDGTDDKAITGMGFEPTMVLTLEVDNTSGARRYFSDSVSLGNSPPKAWEPNSSDSYFGTFTVDWSFIATTGGVKSFDADGITIGDDEDRMNGIGSEYVAIGFKAGEGTETANFEVQDAGNSGGTGNNVAHSLGTAPVWIMRKIQSPDNKDWITDWGFTQDADGFGAPASQTQGITGVSASDWTRGDDTDWNGGPGKHPAVLIGGDDVSGKFKTGTYTGDGANGNAITGLGFQPSLVMIRAIDAAGAFVLVDDLSPKTALNLNNGNRGSGFSLDADGFTVDSGDCNVNTETYRYFAWV